MQTVADMRGVGVKNRGKSADVLCGRPHTKNTRSKKLIQLLGPLQLVQFLSKEGLIQM